jgi:DNA-binding transcriptional LysR family regulator
MYGDAVKITQLYYVRAATDLGSFSRAAASLGVTQPALSNGIAALERLLGGTLFTRSTTGAVPTVLALRVLPQVNGVLANLEAMLAEARAAAGLDAQPLRVGVSPLIPPVLIARAFEAARNDPPITLVLTEDNLADLRAGLLARRLDVMFVPAVADTDGCARRLIGTEAIHYLPSAATTPTLAAHGQVELGDLSGKPLVMVGDACGLSAFTRALFAQSGALLRPYPGEADSYRSLEEWANLGLGGALLPRSRFGPDQQTRPVLDGGRPVQIRYEACWFTHSIRAAAVEALLDAITSPTNQTADRDLQRPNTPSTRATALP